MDGATNDGIREALKRGADAVMLLNNDCYVTSDAVGTLVAAMRECPDAIVAPIQGDAQSRTITVIAPRHRLGLGFPTTPGSCHLTSELEAMRLLPAILIGGGRGVIIPAAYFLSSGYSMKTNFPITGLTTTSTFVPASEGSRSISPPEPS